MSESTTRRRDPGELLLRAHTEVMTEAEKLRRSSARLQVMVVVQWIVILALVLTIVGLWMNLCR